MAAPTYIPIKGDVKSHSGPLGIVKVSQPRSTEIEALQPRRQRPERQYTFEPPTYVDREGVNHCMVWCPSCAEKLARGENYSDGSQVLDEWHRREAFYRDSSRPNGLDGYCRKCKNPRTAAYMREYRARKREQSIGVNHRNIDRSINAA